MWPPMERSEPCQGTSAWPAVGGIAGGGGGGGSAGPSDGGGGCAPLVLVGPGAQDMPSRSSTHVSLK
jgi:hypothetical protein